MLMQHCSYRTYAAPFLTSLSSLHLGTKKLLNIPPMTDPCCHSQPRSRKRISQIHLDHSGHQVDVSHELPDCLQIATSIEKDCTSNGFEESCVCFRTRICRMRLTILPQSEALTDCCKVGIREVPIVPQARPIAREVLVIIQIHQPRDVW